FLCLLSFGEAKESRSPAGARPGKPRTKHQLVKESTQTYSINPGNHSATPGTAQTITSLTISAAMNGNVPR
ncbi:hypothetical protein EZ242_09900, partial [Ramlibacter rhizophilus]